MNLKDARLFFRAVLLWIAFAIGFSGYVHAQDQEWWFDVEVIVFSRLLDAPPDETFETLSTTPSGYQQDIIGKSLYADVGSVLRTFPLCDVEPSLPTVDDIIANHHSWLQSQIPETTEEANLSLSDEGIVFLTTQTDTVEPIGLVDSATTSTQATIDDVSNDAGIDAQLMDTEQPGLSVETENALLIEEPMDPVVARIEMRQAYIDAMPDIIPVTIKSDSSCIESSQRVEFDDIQWYELDTALPRIASVPRSPIGINQTRAETAHILSVDDLGLTELARDIQRFRDARVLLHTVWRQEVEFGRNNADIFRLIAGQDYHYPLALRAEFEQRNENLTELDTSAEDNADTIADVIAQQSDLSADDNAMTTPDMAIDLSETPVPEDDNFFDELNAALNGPIDTSIVDAILKPEADLWSDPSRYEAPLWQIDGEFKVFLQYIGGVPYLHIDNNIGFRRPTSYTSDGLPVEFEIIPLTQLRRVISQQIHYFDHPLFGVIVQIRRHQRPALTDPSETELSE